MELSVWKILSRILTFIYVILCTCNFCELVDVLFDRQCIGMCVTKECVIHIIYKENFFVANFIQHTTAVVD